MWQEKQNPGLRIKKEYQFGLADSAPALGPVRQSHNLKYLTKFFIFVWTAGLDLQKGSVHSHSWRDVKLSSEHTKHNWITSFSE